MSKGTTVRHFSPCAALGVKLGALDDFGPIRDRVRIAQKVVKAGRAGRAAGVRLLL
jgi:hypothetical protein